MGLEKKIKNKRLHTIVMIIVAVLIAAAILLAIFLPRSTSGPRNGTVTIEIRCDQLSEDMSKLNDKTLEQYIPKDGIILAETEWKIKKKDRQIFNWQCTLFASTDEMYQMKN